MSRDQGHSHNGFFPLVFMFRLPTIEVLYGRKQCHYTKTFSMNWPDNKITSSQHSSQWTLGSLPALEATESIEQLAFFNCQQQKPTTANLFQHWTNGFYQIAHRIKSRGQDRSKEDFSLLYLFGFVTHKGDKNHAYNGNQIIVLVPKEGNSTWKKFLGSSK